MREIVLHIGMHKTGSSSIQRALTGYDDGITKYADLGYENHSIPFYTAFSGSHQNYHIWQSAGFSVADIEQKKINSLYSIEKSLEGYSGRRVVFSGEDISLIPEQGVIELGNILKKYSDKVLVVGYFRDPDSFVRSNWQEDIKNGVNALNLQGPSYRSRFEKFIRFFGIENVVLKHFQKEKLLGGDAVSDFCSVVNIDLIKTPDIVNASLSTEAVKCVYILNSFIDPADGDQFINEARRIFISTVSKLLPGGFSVPAGFVNNAINDNDCEWLEGVTGVRLSRGGDSNKIESFNESADLFFQSLKDDTINILLGHLNISSDFSRDPRKIVHRLYLESCEKIWRKKNIYSLLRGIWS
ncbi:hypothetical protein [Pseudomonas helleri]|uniref:Sulfotransferase domain-containing protein n=1 Tax=Pseudomonas helleri TaxID=1608996 RepID=A0A7X1XIN6_9PSED|nr:hypothetical protein [Pseudomonas helleri]MQT92202.1 hypothetical protein [Pseudomonas helleri]